MALKGKSPSESAASMTELVLPNDTNTLGKLMGGKLLHYMDIVAAIAASRHSNRICVTASVDSVDFKTPIALGEVINLAAKVTRAFHTSMEVKIIAEAENMVTGERRRANQAYYTFVAIDQIGRPIPVAPLEPETDEEKFEYQEALKRREWRLVLAGKMEIKNAKHLHPKLEGKVKPTA